MPEINVADNLDRLRERMALACARAGRSEDTVRLVAVSKRVDLHLVEAAAAAGQRDFGENRIQDALPRQDDLAARLGAASPPLRWHFIGHLQRNKAARAAGRFALIHGVHSAELATRLDQRAGDLETVQPVLLQVNVTGEPQKDGLDCGQVRDVACTVSAMDHLDLRGLMAMARYGDAEAALRRTFAALRDLRDTAATACGRPLPELSMGMSGDFESAILEGATLIRVGTAIFGPRTG